LTIRPTVMPQPTDPGLFVRLATPDDIPAIRDLMNECCDWLRTTGKGHNGGVDQWPDRFELSEIQEEFEIGEFYIAYRDRNLAASFRFTDRPQWYSQIGSNDKFCKDIAARMNITESELGNRLRQTGLDQPAIHWHSFAVKRALAGQALGYKLLEWGEAATYQRGFQYLRLDCHHLNDRLRQYYIDAGFQSLHIIGENPFGGIFHKRLPHKEEFDA